MHQNYPGIYLYITSVDASNRSQAPVPSLPHKHSFRSRAPRRVRHPTRISITGGSGRLTTARRSPHVIAEPCYIASIHVALIVFANPPHYSRTLRRAQPRQKYLDHGATLLGTSCLGGWLSVHIHMLLHMTSDADMICRERGA